MAGTFHKHDVDTDALQHVDYDKEKMEEVEQKDISSDNVGNSDDTRDDEYGNTSDGKVKWTKTQIGAVISLCALWVGSQIPLYFVGGSLSYIVADLGNASGSVWLPVCNTLVLAAVSPFAGYLQDLFGRRNITLFGSAMVMVGIILVGTAHSFAQGVVGMSIAGGGAAIGELTALAGTSELVPVKKRGMYIGIIVCFLAPMTPYVLYSQLLSTRTSQGWRWCLWIALIYNAFAMVGILAFYFPERHHQGYQGPKMDIIRKIDYLGAFLSIAGVTLFAHVLAPLLIGIILTILFVLWEWKGASQPLIPREIFHGQRAVAMSFTAAFVGGMNFYSLLNFFPLTYETVYTPTPLKVGIYGLGYGMSVSFGAAFFNFMLSVFKKRNREVLVLSAVIMTAFGGALATVTPENPGLSVALGTLCGFGTGGLLVPTQAVAISCSPDDHIASTVALSLAFRVIGGSIGYAIYYNVFVNKLTTRLPELVAEYAINAGLPVVSATEFVGTFLTVPSNATNVAGVTPAILAAAVKGSQWAYSESLRMVWLTSIPFGVCAIVACCFIGSTGKFMTNRVAAHIKTAHIK
ncbi:putative major facilitator superfamily transporter [Hyaloscypha variabilis F]|uniref:Putative major facilitator superfamily transporter n=1 Tax=Hyaloscypha variabilis (strain UAMH 11265 / GT02V1 / F) TaxID=1149755 RepID=A0A2J6R2C6_HYAVF|nr:putative major facilitator superfamily transporter [Hyaloscypha variabilis F]